MQHREAVKFQDGSCGVWREISPQWSQSWEASGKKVSRKKFPFISYDKDFENKSTNKLRI